MLVPVQAHPSFSLSLLGLLVVLWCFLARFVGRKAPSVRFPPGPRGDPLIGNARHMPSQFLYIKFHDWAVRYRSDLIHLRLFGRSLVVLDSYKAVIDLLEKRATLYSDRPEMTMTADLMGFGWATIFTPYGPEFRKNRRLLHHAFNPTAARAYTSLQERCLSEFLRKALESPSQVDHHVRGLASSISLELAYGRKVTRGNGGDLAKIVEEGMAYFNQGVSGGWLVDFLPALKHVPAWLPGAHFRRLAHRARPFSSQMLEVPFEAVKASMIAGTSDTSFTHNLLAEQGLITGATDEEDLIKRNAATLFGAGADTIVSSFMSFILAMTLHPEFQKKAQTEIDRVIGDQRLPTLADRPNLPYVNCIVKEVLRWNPAGPMGSPRRVMEDDVYEGMLIPKGATIIANVWAMMHDESSYENPFEFNSDRFDCEHPPRDPHLMAFGFGRRICPGLALASSIIFLFVAQTLATFDIQKAVDETGAEIIPQAKFTSGVISHTEPFEYNMSPRSKDSAELVLSVSRAFED